MKRVKTIKVVKIKETANANQITVQVSYDEGGMNYFSGGTTQRGLHLIVLPELVKKDPNSNFTSRQFTLFSGFRKHVLPMNRFSQKKFDEFMPDEQLVNDMVDRICREKNYEKI